MGQPGRQTVNAVSLSGMLKRSHLQEKSIRVGAFAGGIRSHE
jgi:hypothetical protein